TVRSSYGTVSRNGPSPAPLAPRLPDGTWDRAGAAGPRSRRDVKWYERRLATPATAVTAATRIATATAPTTKTSTQSPMPSTVNFEKPSWRIRLSTAAVNAPARSHGRKASRNRITKTPPSTAATRNASAWRSNALRSSTTDGRTSGVILSIGDLARGCCLNTTGHLLVGS